MAPELKGYYPDTDDYFNYFKLGDTQDALRALADLHTYLESEGPYHGVLAYSHGASFVTTYMMQQQLCHPTKPPPFRCAIFLSGGLPADPNALERGHLRLLDPAKDGVPLRLPTSHIWGRNDSLYPGTSETLSALCDPPSRSIFVHDGGHNVPNTKANEDVLGAVRAIRRTIDRALM